MKSPDLARPLDEIPGLNQFQINPNSANGNSVVITNLIEGESNSTAVIKVYDMAMKLEKEVNIIITDDNNFILPISFLTNGIYLLELKINNYPSQFQKLIINSNN